MALAVPKKELLVPFSEIPEIPQDLKIATARDIEALRAADPLALVDLAEREGDFGTFTDLDFGPLSVQATDAERERIASVYGYADESSKLYVGKEFTPDQFAAWWKVQRFGSMPFNGVGWHHTAIPDRTTWVGLQHLHNTFHYYNSQLGWPKGKGPHLWARSARSGKVAGPRIYVGTHPASDGIGISYRNHRYLHVEFIDRFTYYAMTSEDLWLARFILKIVCGERKMPLRHVPGTGVDGPSSPQPGYLFHRRAKTDIKDCPGAKVIESAFDREMQKQDGSTSPAPSPAPKPSPGVPEVPNVPDVKVSDYNFTASGQTDAKIATAAANALLEAKVRATVGVHTTDAAIRQVSESCYGGGKVADGVNIVVGLPALSKTHQPVRSFFTETGILHDKSRTDSWDAVGRAPGATSSPKGGTADTELKVLVCLMEIARREALDAPRLALLYADKLGWLDDLCDSKKPDEKPEAPAPTRILGDPRSLLGKPYLTVEEAQAWAKRRGAHQRFVDLAPIYWKYAAQIGIRPETLYAQSALETNFGAFTGKVPPTYNNPAGIKKRAISNHDIMEDHEIFASWDEGVRAHVNHLAAYIGLKPIGTPHGRYHVVAAMPWAGSVKTIDGLSGKYAPRTDYARFLWSVFLEDLLGLKKSTATKAAGFVYSREYDYLDTLTGDREAEIRSATVRTAEKRAVPLAAILALVSYVLISYGAPEATPELLEIIFACAVGGAGAGIRIYEGIRDARKNHEKAELNRTGDLR